MNAESDSDAPSEDAVVCPKCLLANPPAAPFCADCGAPIGMVANIDPIQRIYAEGFAYRSAVDGPPKLIIVVGMWLIFGPFLLVTSFFLLIDSASSLPGTAFLGLLALASIIVLYRTTKNYIVRSRGAHEPSA